MRYRLLGVCSISNLVGGSLVPRPHRHLGTRLGRGVYRWLGDWDGV